MRCKIVPFPALERNLGNSNIIESTSTRISDDQKWDKGGSRKLTEFNAEFHASEAAREEAERIERDESDSRRQPDESDSRRLPEFNANASFQALPELQDAKEWIG